MSGQSCNTLAKYVANYKTPNSDMINHQIETKHQVDMDKACQHHHIKQDLIMSTKSKSIKNQSKSTLTLTQSK